ncbi:hypothetical protein M9458_027983, partial [Cirrhinus mrigala]
MSYNHPYRNQPDDYGASNDKYKDSQRLYHRESTAYSRRLHPHQNLSSHLCGLDAEDLQTLAELPEHLIATDTLPDLLAQIKKKKASGTTSSSSSSSHSWDNRSHTQLGEYSLDLPVRQSYSLPREQLPTWDDHWEDVQQANSPACTYTSSDPNYVVEYNHLKDKEPYFDKSSYATEPSRQKTYNRDVSHHSSHLSSRDAASHQSSYLLHIALAETRDFGQDIGQDVGLPSLLSNRDTGPPSLLSGRSIAPSSLLSSRDVGPSSHPSTREVGLPSLLSIRDLAPTSHLSSRDIGQSSRLRRTEKEASDFHGKTPPVFPYACVLCDITVLSNK